MAFVTRRPSAGVIFHSEQGCQGGFNRSSQHLVMMEVFDGSWRQAVAGGADRCEAAVGGGSGVECAYAFAGAARAVAGGAAGVLAVDRHGGLYGQCVGGRRGVGPCWDTVVPACWWDATIELGGSDGPLPVFPEREEIALLRVQGVGVREIARRLGRDRGTISREVRRNAATRGGKLEYRASVAQWKAQQAAKRPKTAKLAGNDRLRGWVRSGWPGMSTGPTGRSCPAR